MRVRVPMFIARKSLPRRRFLRGAGVAVVVSAASIVESAPARMTVG